MLRETCLAAVILVVASSGLPQEKPDFSGEWILNRSASTLSPGADAVQSGVWHIEHREPTFRHKAALVTAGKPFNYEYQLLTDGREVVATQQGVRTVSTLRWEGTALVATFRTERSGGERNVSFRYELVDAGRRLRASEQVRGTDHDQDNVWIFDGQPAPRPTATTPELESREQAVTADDVRILTKASELLKDESVWNRADDRVCKDDEATGKRSLFCALQKACIDVLGTYDHRRVALQEVRFAVEDATRGQHFEHRLRDFNNLPSTRLADIKAVLQVATGRVKSRLKSK